MLPGTLLVVRLAQHVVHYRIRYLHRVDSDPRTGIPHSPISVKRLCHVNIFVCKCAKILR